MAARLPSFAVESAGHDRIAERRDDEAFLSRVWADPATRALLLVGQDLAVTDRGELLTVGADQAPPGTRMLLGAAEGVVYVAVAEVPPTPELSESSGSVGSGGGADGEPLDTAGEVARAVAAAGGSLASLRQVMTRVPAVHASLAVHAVGLAGWHRTHPRCSVCGAETLVAQAGAVRRCPACGAQHFPRTDPAVIMLVVDDDGRCLLGHNAARDPTWYSTLAGFVEPGEALEDAVAREVAEETGVRVDQIEYLGSQPWPFPSSLMVGFRAHAASTDIAVDGVEITEARWFTRDDVTTEVTAGRLVIPTTISISGALLEHWYGQPLPVPPRAG